MSATAPLITEPAAGRDWLPEDLRSSPSLEKFKTPGDVAKSYLELEKMASGGVKIPKDDADPKDWEPVYTKLGRPATPDAYQIARPADLPAGLEYDEGLEKSLRATAHSLGLNNKQLQGIANAISEHRSGQFTQDQKAGKTQQEEHVATLKKQWGNDYDKNLGAAKAAIGALAKDAGMSADDIKKVLNESGWGDDPRLARIFAEAGKLRAEDAPELQGGAAKTDDENEIRQKIEAMFDAKHPYMNERADPKLRLAAQQDMLKLQEKLVELRENA